MDRKGSATIFFQMIATIIAVSIVYWFAIFPVWNYLKEWAIWFGNSIHCKEIVDLANFSSYILVWIPYIFIVIAIIWAFRKALEVEAFERIFRF